MSDVDDTGPATHASVIVHPTPTDEEAAAIAAALTFSWPEGGAPAEEPATSNWRWSGRWWAKPIAMRRNRPWT